MKGDYCRWCPSSGNHDGNDHDINPSNLRVKDDWWKKEEATVETYRAMDTLDRINLE